MKGFLLCVAEKPSVAKKVSTILSEGHFEVERSPSKFNSNFLFFQEFLCKRTQVCFTSVSGHIFDLELPPQFRVWDQTDEYLIFDQEPIDVVAKASVNIQKNLLNLAKKSFGLFLWLDNDREGEYISEEVERICLQTNPRLKIYRARFSSLSEKDVYRAFFNPTDINRNEALAVKLRREMDFKTGVVFTRYQTRHFKEFFPNSKVISYGSCQFPTLGFIVRAYLKNKNFEPEPFWTIDVEILKDDIKYLLKWVRKRLFCKLSCFALYASLLDNHILKVESVDSTPKKNLKPLPLTTVELQKRCSRWLDINSNEVMDIAESLYQKGYISYPRTETDCFPSNFDFLSIIEELKKFDPVREYATNLPSVFRKPRNGKHSDNAHSPIYPITVPDSFNTKRDEKVFKFICQHFLASCSPDAEGKESTIIFVADDERFKLKGLTIEKRGWLDIYPYIKWSEKEIPTFQVSEAFVPISIVMNEGKTTPPPLLTESELINIMYKEGIGTDATFQEHIKKIQERGYVTKNDKHFVPTILGLALNNVYENLGFEFMKPTLRAEMESTLVDISNGIKNFLESKSTQLSKYKSLYEVISRKSIEVKNAMRTQSSVTL